MWDLATKAAPIRQQNSFHSRVGVMCSQQACGGMQLRWMLPPPLDLLFSFSLLWYSFPFFPCGKRGRGQGEAITAAHGPSPGVLVCLEESTTQARPPAKEHPGCIQ